MIKKISFSFLMLLSLNIYSQDTKSAEGSSIFTRRSIRRYLPQKVEKEKIDRILRAAMQGPSAGNQRGFEFIVIEDTNKLKALANLGPYSDPVARATIAILVVGTSENIPFPEALDYDLSVSSQNILLQVAEEGLGAVWLSVAPYKDRMEYVRAELKIPEGKYPFSLIPIGYSREKNRFIDRFDSSKIYYNNY